MEEKLVRWMREQERKGRWPKVAEIKMMAKSWVGEGNKGKFKASKGWLEKFLKRNGIKKKNEEVKQEK
jgi:hypothetical protein